uniref:DDE Tnp4 domain-containing protein n=1 Tax=Cyprinus carpio TaxID=7962 RepID=A0A8C1ZFG2_CYPCA
RRLWLWTQNERQFHSLIQEHHKEYFRLCPANFDQLLRMIAPLIERQDTTLRQAIGPAERLAICLRFLATGDSSTVYIPVPLRGSPVNGLFHTAWVPLMGSTLQSKLLLILGQFSLVLLAVIDANHLLRVVDIGAFGKSSDGGTLSASALGRALRDGTLNLPDDEPLPNGEHLGKVPFVFVGDEAFPLRKHLLRPYPGRAIPADQRIFNFRLSHGRRIFRVYHRVMELSPCNAEKIVQATTILHYFNRWGHENSPSTTGSALNAAGRMGSSTASREALAVRDQYREYFSSPCGAVP